MKQCPVCDCYLSRTDQAGNVIGNRLFCPYCGIALSRPKRKVRAFFIAIGTILLFSVLCDYHVFTQTPSLWLLVQKIVAIFLPFISLFTPELIWQFVPFEAHPGVPDYVEVESRRGHCPCCGVPIVVWWKWPTRLQRSLPCPNCFAPLTSISTKFGRYWTPICLIGSILLTAPLALAYSEVNFLTWMISAIALTMVTTALWSCFDQQVLSPSPEIKRAEPPEILSHDFMP